MNTLELIEQAISSRERSAKTIEPLLIALFNAQEEDNFDIREIMDLVLSRYDMDLGFDYGNARVIHFGDVITTWIFEKPLATDKHEFRVIYKHEYIKDHETISAMQEQDYIDRYEAHCE